MDKKKQLLEAASSVWDNSYSPYSKFKVASAVLSDGKIFTGVNVENVSFGLTICAERTAIFNMVTQGFTKLEAVLVMTEKGDTPPCGACRQVMAEFAQDIPIFISSPKEIIFETTLKKLLPSAFTKF